MCFGVFGEPGPEFGELRAFAAFIEGVNLGFHVFGLAIRGQRLAEQKRVQAQGENKHQDQGNGHKLLQRLQFLRLASIRHRLRGGS